MGLNCMSPPRILSKKTLATASSNTGPFNTANLFLLPLFTATSDGAFLFLTPNALAVSVWTPPSIHTNENGSFLYFLDSSIISAFSGNSSVPPASTTNKTHVPLYEPKHSTSTLSC